MAAALAENYQLKWHSHGTHLHSSIATLQRSESFADVTLATSDGRYLAAHRFVLSACSSYLHQMLEIGSVGSSPNSNLVVVLPSEITYRTLTILLQYMYSGEATVSNEQLNGVLKAGETLRVRGLCHTKENSGQPRPGGLTRIVGQESNGENSLKRSSERALNCSTDVKKASLHKELPANMDEREQPPKKSESVLKNNIVGTKCKDSQPPQPKVVQDDVTVNQEENSTKESSKKKNGLSNSVRSEMAVGSEARIEEAMQIEMPVKEEPVDWEEVIEREEDEDPIDDDYLHTELTIKAEAYSSMDEQEEDDDYYAPLTCDLCQETFTTPALWVRHVESHPTTDISRRRRKRQLEDSKEEENGGGEFPPLRCELCQEVFTVPADWVRHIQSAHTEEQLASNNERRGRSGSLLQVRKHCHTCGKSFPSHASMLIHSRTHTGERPYVCHVCEKGFNVKSNLLRHLRTLHDQIITPSMVQ